jgi:hypothetical protein
MRSDQTNGVTSHPGNEATECLQELFRDKGEAVRIQKDSLVATLPKVTKAEWLWLLTLKLFHQARMAEGEVTPLAKVFYLSRENKVTIFTDSKHMPQDVLLIVWEFELRLSA